MVPTQTTFVEGFDLTNYDPTTIPMNTKRPYQTSLPTIERALSKW